MWLTNVQVCTSSVIIANVVPHVNQVLSQHIARLEKQKHHFEKKKNWLHRYSSYMWEDNTFVFLCGLLCLLIWCPVLDVFAFLMKARWLQPFKAFQCLMLVWLSSVLWSLLNGVQITSSLRSIRCCWMVGIRKQLVICVNGFSLNLNIKFIPLFFFSLHSPEKTFYCQNWCYALSRVSCVYNG